MTSVPAHQDALAPSGLHREWGRRLAALSPGQLRDEAEQLRERADLLGIWSRGGMVPLQPFVVPDAASARLHALGRDLHRLVVDHAVGLADGDLRRLADHVGWPESERWVLGARTPLGPVLGSSRTDVMVSGGSARVLELNVGTCLNGSTSTPVLVETLLDTAVARSLLQGHPPAEGFVDALAAWLLRGRRHPGDRVALVSSVDASDEGSTRWAEHQVRLLAAHGVSADLVPVEEIDVVDGVLTRGGHRYRQAVRFFMLSGPLLAHRDAVVALEGAAGTHVHGGYLSQLFTSKVLLADLLQRRDLPQQARRTLAHVPWTARLREGPAWRDGRRVDPVEWTLEHRDRAVLKPSHLFGSRGVSVGRFTSGTDWDRLVHEAAGSGDHVVQELVEPDAWPCTYWSLDEERLVTVDGPVCLGPFTVDGRAGGTFVQQPVGGGWPGLPGAAGEVSLGAAVGA